MALVQFTNDVARKSGRVGGQTIVNTYWGGAGIIRGFTNPANPQTEDQQLIRAYFSEATKRWGQVLTADQRAAWSAWAAANPVTNRLGTVVKRTGLSAYVQLETTRRVMTGAWGTGAAPGLPRPPAPSALGNVTWDVPTSELGWQLVHPVTLPTTRKLIVRVTPPLNSPAINPAPSEYRLVKGVTAASYVAMVASGTQSAIADPRFSYPATTFYMGLEISIVNVEGWEGEPIRFVGAPTINT